jgi:molecular chaperone HtpG
LECGQWLRVPLEAAPARGTRVVLNLMEDAKSYTDRFTLERIVKAQSGHVPVPIAIVEKPGAEPAEIADGAALWTKSKSDISAADYPDFYRGDARAFSDRLARVLERGLVTGTFAGRREP